MVAGAIMLLAAAGPPALLRVQSRAPAEPSCGVVSRASLVLGVVGLAALTFPRLGFFLLPALVVVATAVRPVRVGLLSAWPRHPVT